MDYYRTSTKILDSWDIINLPTARRNRDQIRDRSSDDNGPSAREHNCARKKLARRKESFRHRKKVESCTSLVFKKTDKPVLNDYSVFSYTNIIQSHGPVHGDHGAKHPAPRKPVIKVTVIPNKDTKTSNKRKETARKATTKKTEKFKKNKDFYFVVAGRKKEKIYLNTITAQYSDGSLRSNDKSTNDCANIKELFKINLNKCKKSITYLKNKNTKVDEVEYSSRCNCECRDLKFIRTEQVEYIKMSNNKGSAVQRTKKNSKAAEQLRMAIPVKENCNLNRERLRMSPRASADGEKSRIRITGRVGLNQDDKYVLKCNATLDDEPIPTLPTNENLMSMLCLDREGKRSSRNQRDCKVQADVRCYSPGYGQTSQATQVNFEIIYPQKFNSKNIFANNDKIVQCYCTNTAENSALASDERGDIALKECASPIVIISVYPQQESTDKVTNTFNITECKTKCPTQAECSQRNTKKITNSEEAKIKPKKTRSRSPSPTRNKEKKNKESNLRTRVNISNSKKKLGETTNSTVKTPKTKSSKIPTSIQVNSFTNKKTERPKSPVPPKLSPTRKAGSKQKTQNTTGTNTEQRLTKKALVDNFTKQYTARMNGKCRKYINERSARSTKHDVSNVTINIEGDNEFYNVMFHQSALDTDVTVRKTPKGLLSNFARDNDSTSLENFLLSENDGNRVHTSFSQTYLPAPDYPQTQPTTSKLNIKDSIQVCHWREEKHYNDEIAHTDYSSNRNEVHNAFLAPMKHFQGDDCSISDPNERDREIRELLGIDRRNFKPPGHKSAEANTIFGRRNEVSLNCLYQDHSVNVCKGKNKDLTSTSIQHNPLYHMLILNRNIKLLLQIKPSNKQPIVLSRQQYAKVKRAIYANILKKYSLVGSRRSCSLKDSSVSIGSIKIKSKENMTFHYNKETQTVLDMTLTMHVKETKNCVNSTLPCAFSSSGEAKKGSAIHKSLDQIRNVFSNSIDKHKRNSEQPEVRIFYDASFKSSLKQEPSHRYPRRAASSVEVQYAEVVYTKPVKLSNSEIGSKAPLKDLESRKHCKSENFEQIDSNSIHTIFKGRRRCHTPNLGTSAYSLPGTSDSVSEHSDLLFKCLKHPANCEQKPKKPFLRRLISCLVMRAPETSAAKFPVGRTVKDPSVLNSDWYYINSSLCGIDMSSSLYDTSASFYSNHSVPPAARMKRGFFSSVRGFLASRS